MIDSHVGHFKYTGEFLVKAPFIIQQIYASVIPVSVVYDPVDDVYLVTAYSAEFRSITEGEHVPWYDVIITQTPFNHIIKFEEHDTKS